MDYDGLCDGCKAGESHHLHYSAAGTPMTGMQATCQITWWRKPAILIECAGKRGYCRWSAWWNDRSLSDGSFTRRAAEQGWTILPTRCPQHAATKGGV